MMVVAIIPAHGRSLALIARGECVKHATPTIAEDLQILTDQAEEGTRLRLRGRLAIVSSPALRDQLLEILRAEVSNTVTVDLTEVSYIDTSGIATLIEALRIARNHQIRLCVLGLQGRMVHFFRATGLMNLFEANGCGSVSESKVS